MEDIKKVILECEYSIDKEYKFSNRPIKNTHIIQFDKIYFITEVSYNGWGTHYELKKTPNEYLYRGKFKESVIERIKTLKPTKLKRRKKNESRISKLQQGNENR